MGEEIIQRSKGITFVRVQELAPLDTQKGKAIIVSVTCRRVSG
jgi:hypothetical protein